MRFHSCCLFHTGLSLLVDFDLCAPTRLAFFDIGQSLLVDFDLCASTRLVFFDIGQALLADFDLCAPTRLVFFDIGLSLLMNFGMCSPTRLVFLTLVSCCWWTLTCALPLVLSFSHWSVTVGGLWLVSCLFHTGLSLLVDFGLCASTRLVFFDTGQSLLVDIGLCASTRLVFFDIGQSLLVEFGLCAPTTPTDNCIHTCDGSRRIRTVDTLDP